MNDTVYNALTENNIDVHAGSEKYNGNADLYMIFLKNYFQENDIIDMKRCIDSGDIAKCVFYASAFLSASKELYVNEIADLVAHIKELLEKNLIEDAKKIMSILEPKYTELRNIIIQA